MLRVFSDAGAVRRDTETIRQEMAAYLSAENGTLPWRTTEVGQEDVFKRSGMVSGTSDCAISDYSRSAHWATVPAILIATLVGMALQARLNATLQETEARRPT